MWYLGMLIDLLNSMEIPWPQRAQCIACIAQEPFAPGGTAGYAAAKSGPFVAVDGPDAGSTGVLVRAGFLGAARTTYPQYLGPCYC